MGVAPNTVRAALVPDRAPKYSWPARGSLVDAVEPEIRKLLRVEPRMPATVIAEWIGWKHSNTILKDRLREPATPGTSDELGDGDVDELEPPSSEIHLPRTLTLPSAESSARVTR